MNKKVLAALGLTLAFSFAYSRQVDDSPIPLEQITRSSPSNLETEGYTQNTVASGPSLTNIIAGEYFVDNFSYEPEELRAELTGAYISLQSSIDEYAFLRDEMVDIDREKDELKIEYEESPTNSSDYSEKHSELSSRWWNLHHEATRILKNELYDDFSDYEQYRREVGVAKSLADERRQELPTVKSVIDLSREVGQIDRLLTEQERDLKDVVLQYGLKIYLHEMGITYSTY